MQKCWLETRPVYVIYDPLGQTHGPASSDHISLETCFVLQDFEKWGRTYVRTDDMCENSDHYQP